MARITTPQDDDAKPRIVRQNVEAFFEERAARIETLGPVRAVIYQDKHPNLAELRDHAEKERLLPLMSLDGTQRVLDIGCGTGRWTGELVKRCVHYHGLDFSSGLIAHARSSFPETENLRFSIASADAYTLDSLGERKPFDRILCCGVMIYMNDDEAVAAMRCMRDVAGARARIILREPVATVDRLTIRQHFSDELQQEYNAIYRTQEELEDMISFSMAPSGFKATDSGDVYLDAGLNNRSETRQRWLLLERQ